jgi:hypothetical protein
MKLRKIDWLIILILLVLGIIPDPTDIFDMGLPILESLMAFLYYWWRTRKS